MVQELVKLRENWKICLFPHETDSQYAMSNVQSTVNRNFDRRVLSCRSAWRYAKHRFTEQCDMIYMPNTTTYSSNPESAPRILSGPPTIAAVVGNNGTG